MERFYKDIELMIGYRPTRIYKAAWGVITPIIITVSNDIYVSINFMFLCLSLTSR